MTPIRFSTLRARGKQTGMSTILISMLLLLIVTIIVLFASSVSIKEVRTGGNQFRSTRAFDAAQYGLNLGLEFLNANRSLIASTNANGWLEQDLEQWEPCPADGVLADDFPCDAERDPLVRANLLRYRGSLNLPVSERYRLPLTQPSAMPQVDIDGDGIADTSDAALRYRVGALLCMIDPQLTTAGNVCDFALSRLADETPQAYAVHLLARGAVMSADATATALPEAMVGGEPLAEARTTVAQNYGSFRLIAEGPDAPLIAANSVTMRGTFDIVANANGGGFGIPLSIWTSSIIDPNGTPKSCYIQEFLTTDPSGVEIVDGVSICDRCECPREGSLSYKDGGTFIKGNDIVDATGNAQITGERNFPTDMFEYLFGVPKIDSAGNPRWTEIRDRATLLDGTCTNDPLAPRCCSDLSTTSTGLFWSEEATCALSQDIIGTPSQPVFVVTEKGFTMSADRYFGVLYKFARPGDANSYQLRVNGGGAIYGALVADTNSVVDKATGSFALVYSSEVMSNLTNSPGLLKLGPVPGSWTDLGVY